MLGHGLPLKMKVMVRLWIWKMLVNSDMNRVPVVDMVVVGCGEEREERCCPIQNSDD